MIEDLKKNGGEAKTETVDTVESESGEEEVENEEQIFEKKIQEYSLLEFIKHLMDSIAIDKSKIAEFCPYMVERNFKVFDQILERDLHFFEMIIYTASGRSRTSLLPILTIKHPVTQVDFKVLKATCS